MASGTYQDPHIVSSWEQFIEDYNNNTYIGQYVKFTSNGTNIYDLTKSYPSGINGGLVIYPHIIGSNFHLKGLYIYNALHAIDFKGTVENLYIDAVYVYDVHSVLEIGGSATKLNVTCQLFTYNDIYLINRDYNGDCTLTDCQMEFKVKARYIYPHGAVNSHKLTLNNCEIYFDWDCQATIFNIITMNASMITGFINADSYVQFFDVKDGTAIYPQSLIDVKFTTGYTYYGTLSGDTSSVVFYNSDKMPAFNASSTEQHWVGVTTATIASETAMNEAGFTTGDESPWNYDFGYLYQDDWETRTRLGAVNTNEQLGSVNSDTKKNIANIPSTAQSIGRNSFKLNHFTEVNMPSACTYYSTSYGNNSNIHGGTLIDD